jgi:predicted phage terminase large subunit-like protein
LESVWTTLKTLMHPEAVGRASPLEPIFEAGNVHLLRAPWTADFLAELEAFPSGNHDDQVDALTGLWIMLQRTGVRLTFL